MNLQFLRYAVEVEKTGSITQAAENLYMNQPHLSRSIRDLEKEMGFMVFNRTSRGIVPTEEGEEFLKYAKEVLAKVTELEKLRDKNKKASDTFSFASIRSGYIQEAFIRIIRQEKGNPGFSYDYEEGSAREVINRVADKTCCMGVTRYPAIYGPYYQKILKEKNLVSMDLARLKYVIWMGRHHPLAEKSHLTYLDLEPYPEVLYGNDGMPTFGIDKEKEDGKRRIFVLDKDSARNMLKRIPGAYMWDVPEPGETADTAAAGAASADTETSRAASAGTEAADTAAEMSRETGTLLQKTCSRPGNEYQDVVLFRQGYKQTELEQRFLELLEEEAEKIVSQDRNAK